MGSRTVVVVALGLWALVWGVGCEAKEPSREQAVARGTEGHAFVAQLLACHPLYKDLVQLELTIRALRRADEPTTAPWQVEPDQGTRFAEAPPFFPPSATDWRWQTERVRGSVRAPAPTRPMQLPADLQVRLEWERAERERQLQAALLAARSQASVTIARQVTELYRKNRERLQAQSEAGESGAGAVTRELAQREAELRAAQEAALASREAQLREQASASEEQSIRGVWAEAARRLEPPTSCGEALRERLGDSLAAFSFPQWTQQPPLGLSPDRTGRDDQAELVEKWRELWRQDRDKRAAELVEWRAQVMTQMLRSTRLAAQKVAHSRGLRLHLVPGDEPVGPDLTEAVGADLQQLWGTFP